MEFLVIALATGMVSVNADGSVAWPKDTAVHFAESLCAATKHLTSLQLAGLPPVKASTLFLLDNRDILTTIERIVLCVLMHEGRRHPMTVRKIVSRFTILDEYPVWKKYRMREALTLYP